MKELYIPDTHFPFTNMKMLHEVYKFNQKFQADRIYQLGDFVDFYGFSRFIRDPSGPSITQEIEDAKKQIRQFAKWFPKVTILMGNHEKRLSKRAREAGLPESALSTLGRYLDLPGGLHLCGKDYHRIDNNTILVHGHLTGANASKSHMDFYGMNVAHGHTHNQLRLEWNPRTIKKIWGMSLSCIVDVDSMAMAYQEQNWKNIICGFGYRDNGKPHVECLG